MFKHSLDVIVHDLHSAPHEYQVPYKTVKIKCETSFWRDTTKVTERKKRIMMANLLNPCCNASHSDSATHSQIFSFRKSVIWGHSQYQNPLFSCHETTFSLCQSRAQILLYPQDDSCLVFERNYPIFLILQCGGKLISVNAQEIFRFIR